MLGFKNFMNAQVSQQRAEDDAAMNNLVQRIGESLVVEDRREALLALCNVLNDDPATQSAFASVGFPTICSAMQMDGDDPTIVRTGLECIALAVAAESSTTVGLQSARAAAVNAEQFARTEGAIPLLLGLLEGRSSGTADGVHVKFTILQILHSLLEANTIFAQQALLRVPTGVSQIVELIGESEVMRNEALLILQRLVAGNPDAQKVAVFSGCLDKIFSVIKEEDYMSGSIIVLDCLQLAVGLLKGNEPNQRMFGELGYQKVLQNALQQECQAMISFQEDTQQQRTPSEFSQERCLNIAAALDVLDACGISRALEQSEMLPTLQKFAAWESSPPWVRTSAWKMLAVGAQHSGSLRHSIEQQQPVEVSRLGKGMPLVQVALHECMSSPLAAGRQSAGDFVACVATPTVQSALLKIVTASQHIKPLIHALLRQGSLPELVISSRAAAALAPLVVNNPNTKQEMLSTEVSGTVHQQQGCILDACAKGLATSVTKHGADPEGQELIVNFGTLLIAWLPDFPPGVQQFLSSISKTPFLVGVVLTENNQFGSGSAVIRGYCAVILGLCCLYAPSHSAVDPKVLMKAMVDQIGLPRYGTTMKKFVEILNFTAAGGSPGGSGQQQQQQQQQQRVWSPAAATWLAGVVGQVHRNVEALATTGAVPQPQQRPPVTVQPQPLQQSFVAPPPQQQQSFTAPPPLGQQKSQQFTSSTRAAVSSGVVSPRSFMPPPPPTHAISMHPSSPTSAPGIDRNAYQGLKNEVQQLRELNAQLEKEVGEAKADSERLQQALVKAEADLEGLSTAYTALDSHATELQARLDKALLVSLPRGRGGGQDVEALIQAARKEAEEEASAAMEDLLVCLGQEEGKVKKLEALLAEARLR